MSWRWALGLSVIVHLALVVMLGPKLLPRREPLGSGGKGSVYVLSSVPTKPIPAVTKAPRREEAPLPRSASGEAWAPRPRRALADTVNRVGRGNGGQSHETGGGAELVLDLGKVVAEGNRPPEYPEEAERRGWEGRVRLRVLLRGDGSVQDVQVVEASGHEILDAAALRAAAEWKFPSLVTARDEPARALRIPVIFRLD